MRKKGFTLIELLAVIIILAIVALIATPIILNIVEDSRMSASKSAAALVLSATKDYYAENYFNDSFTGYECSITDRVGCEEIVLSGDRPDKAVIYLDPEGSVRGVVVFGKYTYYYCNGKVLETDECSIGDINSYGSTPVVTISKEVNNNQNVLTASATSAISGYSYQWYKDDVEITGQTNSTLTAGEAGAYKVVVTTGTGTVVTSNEITIHSYTISYNANGGTGSLESTTKLEDVPVTLTTSTPSRTNYSFKGWSTSSSATSATYASGASYTTNGDITLYAVWAGNYRCTEGSLTQNTSYSTSTGGWICVKSQYWYTSTSTTYSNCNSPYACESGQVQVAGWPCQSAGINSYCCCDEDSTTEDVYGCNGSWSKYNSSQCYKSATLAN